MENRLTRNRLIVRSFLAITLFIFSAPFQTIGSDAYSQDLPGKGVTLKPVFGGSDNNLFVMYVVARGLERLGYDVNPPLSSSIPLMHVAVGQGEADFTPQSWTPLMDQYYVAAGGDETMERIGTTVSGAAQGYLIDKATADAYHITNIDQLKDPKLAALFDTDGNGKANMTGCNPGWGCERVIEHQLDAYKLRDSIDHDQGEYEALIANTIARYQSGQPILYYTWTPLWLGNELVPGKDVVWLEVPFSSLPDTENANTKGPDGRDFGWGLNDITTIVNKQFAAENPAAVRFLSKISIPLDDVNAENMLMKNGEDEDSDIVRHADDWIAKHQSEFDTWVNYAIGE